MSTTRGSAAELERRRRVAVTRLADGWTQAQVADFLGVHERAVRDWWARHRADPTHGLDATPALGRPPKLTPDQEAAVRTWFGQSPTAFGFANELWTAARVAHLIERPFGVRFHPRYVSAWRADRRITPQKPQAQARATRPRSAGGWPPTGRR